MVDTLRQVEQGVELFDRPGLAVVHFNLDDKIMPAGDSGTGLEASWYVGLEIRLQIFHVCRFQQKEHSCFGNEEELHGCEDRDVELIVEASLSGGRAPRWRFAFALSVKDGLDALGSDRLVSL